MSKKDFFLGNTLIAKQKMVIDEKEFDKGENFYINETPYSGKRKDFVLFPTKAAPVNCPAKLVTEDNFSAKYKSLAH